MVRVFKYISCVLALVFLFAVLAGCSRARTMVQEEESIPIGEAYDRNAVTSIVTKYGKLYVPEQYLPALQYDIQEKNDGCQVKFFTEQKGKTIDLYIVSIGIENGEYVGDLKDDDGTVRPVYASVSDLGDLKSYSEEQQDQLFAMQESVNIVVENLK